MLRVVAQIVVMLIIIYVENCIFNAVLSVIKPRIVLLSVIMQSVIRPRVIYLNVLEPVVLQLKCLTIALCCFYY